MRSRPALKVLVFYTGGLLLARIYAWPLILVLPLGFICFLLAFIFWYTKDRGGKLCDLTLIVCLIFIGIIRYELKTNYLSINHISKFIDVKFPMAVSGIVVKYPEKHLDRIILYLSVNEIFYDHKVTSTNGKIQIILPENIREFDYGDELIVRGRLRKPRDIRNPGEFNYREYLQVQGIYASIYVNHNYQIKKISQGHGNWFLRTLVFPLKNYLDAFVETHLPQKEAALMRGLLIGERGEITPNMREAFSRLGVIHILAVSGLHVGFILLICLGFLGFFRLPYSVRIFLTILALIFYAFLTNLKPPVVRASIMAGVILIGTVLERKTDVLNTMAIAALIILLINPLELFQSGFQLSFAAVASIVLIYPKLRSASFIKEMLHKFYNVIFIRYPIELILVSLAVFVGTLPFTMIYFHRVPNFAPLANLVVIPLAFCSLANGILAAALSPFLPLLMKCYLNSTWLFLHLLISFVEWAEKLPFAFWEYYRFSTFYLLAYFTFLFLVVNINKRHVRRALVIFILFLANVLLWKEILSPDTGKLRIVFFDVGQGDAALVTMPDNRHMLIDGGPRSESFDAGRWIVAPYLKRRGIKVLDAVVLSHADTDHLGGLPYILRSFSVREIWDNGQGKSSEIYREYLHLVDSLQIKRKILKTGDILEDFSPVKIFVLHPTSYFLTQNVKNINEGSLVLKISYGLCDFLFAGDIEREGEERLNQYGDFLTSEVLKVPHHGSNTSSTESFLHYVNPNWAIISVGLYNKFDHPSPEVINRLQNSRVKILRTDQSGAVILQSDGKNINVINWK